VSEANLGGGGAAVARGVAASGAAARAGANGDVIEIADVKKIYPMGDTEVRALNGVDLTVAAGEYMAIMGPSGSGKSTLMNIIGCLDTPTSGTYRLSGLPVSEMKDDELARIRNQEIGFVFQTFNLLPRMDAFHNVELPLIYRGMGEGERRDRVRRAMEAVSLADRMRHRPNELSGGQRQRVAIARALVSDPAIILADEPTGNLDSVTGVEIMALFSDIHARGNTVIVVTHEEEIARQTHRIVRLRDGVIEKDETT
jgi:putative ABC transport system ATP-binding protein